MKTFLTKSKTILAGLVLFQVLGSGLSQAATITLDAVDNGQYQNNGSHIPTNPNYVAIADNLGTAFRNFFVFDLSGVSDPIIGATLRLYNPSSFFSCF